MFDLENSIVTQKRVLNEETKRWEYSDQSTYKEDELPYPIPTDFSGQQIEVGDRIAYARSYGSHSVSLATATVLDIEWRYLSGDYKGKAMTASFWHNNELHVYRTFRLKILADDNEKVSRLTEMRGVIVIGTSSHDPFVLKDLRWNYAVPGRWTEDAELVRGFRARCRCGWRCEDWSPTKEDAANNWYIHMEEYNANED